MRIDQVELPDESGLVRLAQRGDGSAFAQLVRNHQDEVFTLALRLVNRHDLAADVSQESFIRAWRALPSFRGDAAFSTWLHRIVVNTAWTLRRRALRQQGSVLDERSLALADQGMSPESAADAVGFRPALRRELAALPEPQRVVVVMKDVYGWSHQEVADTLGISVAAAKVRLHRARKRLRERLWRVVR